MFGGMLGGCLGDAWGMLGGCLEDAWRMLGGCLKDSWGIVWDSLGCLDDAWRMLRSLGRLKPDSSHLPVLAFRGRGLTIDLKFIYIYRFN